ncbi:MAG: 3-methyl-2-oxobutanoate dehydrogenase subunit VorB [Acholeplasma sp.]|nr:MAG: 3-methyl-2-oxobutanoate dehydrogenase subunit VorB [Acholeplasma sp.]
MTSSSSVGIALKQEGISYMAGSELPCVIVSIMRGGPGLGGIQPSQADYFQATRGGGNGDYHVIVFAPESIQETVDLMKEAFDIADQYRNPVMILADGLIGQMMESVDMDKPAKKRDIKPKKYATTGTDFHEGRNIITSVFLDPIELENHNLALQAKYHEVEKNEVRFELTNMDQAEYVIVAYGTSARICRSAIETLADQGIKVGMIRPISLWPFPKKAFEHIPATCKGLLVTEMSMGQMIDDVKIANKGKFPIAFYGRTGGVVPEPEEIVEAILHFNEKVVESWFVMNVVKG